MINTKGEEVVWYYTDKNRTAARRELDLCIQPTGGVPRCYYCNSSLKCGQHYCIWREDVG